ncbi:DNA repair protein RecN [Iodidimonas muriae]|uniref:DNA repair protein RecN n=1 Tax=Iodidimonas muriae TaxID=261467 RepID=A0ABQ2LC36_9PROT|nr:DNA repair protein RecN [Iodidimonas muriae]GER06811.1 DNA repair protein RecN [Kordiimonadales bacterium JCM 17843]GGO09899.1 DNA repair protein RecN [Iodidimonas muriae]
MLLGLTICDIVLIEQLSLSFSQGLTVLTGETGAGKSILLDSLGLAIGARADSGLVRHGASRGSVTASFDLPATHKARAFLRDQEIGKETDCADEPVILRRVIHADGGSRAYVNDQMISVSMMRKLGDLLVEVHGQHDDRGLLDVSGHRALLDAYGGHEGLREAVASAYDAMKAAKTSLHQAEETLAQAQAGEDYLRHALEELDKLAPEAGEEADLAERRALMMQGERLAGTLGDIQTELEADTGVEAQLRGVLRRLERLEPEVQSLLQPVISALDRAVIEAADGMMALSAVQSELDFDPEQAEQVEERLFALRAAGRKYKCAPDDLPALRMKFAQDVASLDHSSEGIGEKRAALERARTVLAEKIADLHKARKDAAQKLDAAVNSELPPLKLEKARFRTRLEPLAQEHWTRDGGDHVAFEISTNPGAPFGGLIKVASGGELARVILALKVSLASRNSAATLVFDEVDRGIGGATADAVGERLARLAQQAQVLVVTHSPQVAARGDCHLQISKADRDDAQGLVTRTDVARLDQEARQEEIARMLSGAEITDAARAAASSLMKQSA